MLKEFGYLPLNLAMSLDDFKITTLPNLEQKVQGVGLNTHCNGDWIRIRAERRVFGMPKTHIMEFAGSEEHCEFLIWCLSFLKGIRLTSSEAGFLDATPVLCGKLVDFHCAGRDLERALQYCNSFFSRNPSGNDASLVVAAIHALFLSRGPHLLCYEQLHYLYTALDACWKVTCVLNRLNIKEAHAKRIEEMCNSWHIMTPPWAVYDDTTKSSALSRVRNEMIHEGLVGKQPLGFRVIDSFDDKPHPINNPLLEVQHLLSRLLVAILGIRADQYIRSATNHRDIFGLDVA